ncbi:uncharacterized protein LOC135202933 isoform X2 [Macrobrachium nipponense]|uniref:uncharacterized protein LOC135202933 isoform X2 n=1 Tax=Macrobrachium nipponense TaxID=159736 RepID=UPI0030C8889D
MGTEHPTTAVINPCLGGMLEAVHEAEEFLFIKMEEKTKAQGQIGIDRLALSKCTEKQKLMNDSVKSLRLATASEEVTLMQEKIKLTIKKSHASKHREEFEKSRNKAYLKHENHEQSCDDIVASALHFYSRIKLSNPAITLAEESKKQKLLQMRLEKKSLLCEIKVLENNDIKSQVIEKKKILMEILDLKTKITLYDESHDNEQKGIDSSAEEIDQMVMRVGNQLKLSLSQNWTLEQSHSELDGREYSKHHAKTPSGRNTFTEKQDKEETPYPSSGETRLEITPSTPQTFTRNPAPPTPGKITASGIPLHLLGAFTCILTDNSSDGSGCGIPRIEETQEDKTHGCSSDKSFFISGSEQYFIPAKDFNFGSNNENENSTNKGCNHNHTTKEYVTAGTLQSSIRPCYQKPLEKGVHLRRTIVVCEEES